MERVRRSWLVSGVALFLAALACAGGGCAIADTPLVSEKRELRAPAAFGAMPVRVEARDGEVTIVRADVPEPRIVAVVRAGSQERLGAIGAVAERAADGALVVRAVAPPDGWRPRDSVAFDIAVPAADGVTVGTTNGAVTLEGLAGPAELRTSNGSVSVASHDGTVRASTSNGRIRVVGAGDVVLRTSNGSIDASGVRGPAEAETSNGGVTLALAPGSTGPVTVETSNGDIVLEVGPAFNSIMTLSSSTGPLSLPEHARRARVRRLGERSAELAFGDGTTASSATTSNGSITVRAAE